MPPKSPAKLDLLREHREEYAPAKEPRLVRVAPARYLSTVGRGAPEGEAFGRAVGGLYAVAYTVKMASKRAGRDFKVMPLEGLWWGKEPNTDFTSEPRETWNWKLLIRVPDLVTAREVAAAKAAIAERGGADGAREVKLERLAEGRCVQALHVGSYATERPTIERMLRKAAEAGLTFRGLHHEIYFSDARKVAPARLRTLLRHAVGQAASTASRSRNARSTRRPLTPRGRARSAARPAPAP